MSYLDKSVEANLVSVRITEKGRELLARGLREDDNFDIVKYSFGDSEINYNISDPDTNIPDTAILEPSSNAKDLVSKLYAFGTVPDGTPTIHLSTANISMSTNQTGVNVTVHTEWPPVEGVFSEEYKWTNLGPLNDWDYRITKSVDTKSAMITTYTTTGVARIKVKGMTSGRYAIITLTIT